MTVKTLTLTVEDDVADRVEARGLDWLRGLLLDALAPLDDEQFKRSDEDDVSTAS